MIRPMTSQDEQLYLRLAHQFYSSEAVLHQLPEQIYHRNFQQLTRQNPYAKGYIIEQDGEPAGYLLLSFTFSAEVGGLVVLVEELYVLPQFQNQGLGRQALEFVRWQFPQAARFRLEVTAQNQGAMRLYRRAGYQPLDYLQMTLDTEQEEREC